MCLSIKSLPLNTMLGCILSSLALWRLLMGSLVYMLAQANTSAADVPPGFLHSYDESNSSTSVTRRSSIDETTFPEIDPNSHCVVDLYLTMRDGAQDINNQIGLVISTRFLNRTVIPQATNHTLQISSKGSTLSTDEFSAQGTTPHALNVGFTANDVLDLEFSLNEWSSLDKNRDTDGFCLDDTGNVLCGEGHLCQSPEVGGFQVQDPLAKADRQLSCVFLCTADQ
ncbi:hypothetical protein F5Y15DRAFT_384285 [Xylariaceae sp. FL0016]|nr:hypothetical protein F5Y15DRAFT_384285 [Xylariaceae sp. FL0016]